MAVLNKALLATANNGTQIFKVCFQKDSIHFCIFFCARSYRLFRMSFNLS